MASCVSVIHPASGGLLRSTFFGSTGDDLACAGSFIGSEDALEARTAPRLRYLLPSSILN